MMRAVRLVRPGSPLQDQHLPDPVAGPGEMVVEVHAAGICHSDAHYRSGRGRVSLPLTLGHEVAGVVAGSGERVALHYLFGNGDMLGKERDGGYAQRVVVEAPNAVAVPPNVSLEQAAIMMCSTATAWHALRLSRLEAGQSLAVIGFGGLGVSAVALARAMGVTRICAVDRVPEKLELAASLGVTPGLEPSDVALEFSGNAEAATTALRSLKPGGRLVIVAIDLQRWEIDPYRDVLAGERQIVGCSDHTRAEVVEVLEMASRGAIDLSAAITRTVPLQARAINAVLDELDRGTQHLRTVILPQ